MRRLVLALLLFSWGCGREPVASKPIAWMTDLDAARAKAASTQRPVLVFVHADWDSASKELEYRTFTDPDVQRLAESYVPLAVDATDDENPKYRPAVERLQVKGTPTLLLLSPDFRTELYREHAFIPPERFASALRYTRQARGANAASGASGIEDLRDLRALAWFEHYRHLIDGVRNALLADPLLDPTRLSSARSCWAEANPATESCLRAEEARTQRRIEEHERLEHEVLPRLLAGTPILGLEVRRGSGDWGSAEPRAPLQKSGTRNAEVGITIDERTTLGWGEYLTEHRSRDGSMRGDRELHPGIEVAWRSGGDYVGLVLLTDGFRRPPTWR
jgi:hypothetical protein